MNACLSPDEEHAAEQEYLAVAETWLANPDPTC